MESKRSVSLRCEAKSVPVEVNSKKLYEYYLAGDQYACSSYVSYSDSDSIFILKISRMCPAIDCGINSLCHGMMEVTFYA